MTFMIRFRENLRHVLSLDESPRKIAMSFSVGIFIGMSGLIGLQTVTSLIMAWALRLNKVAVLTGAFITNPWSIIPIYTFSTWIGIKVMGMGEIFPNVDWRTVTVLNALEKLSHVILPFFVGTTLVAAVSGLVSYIIIKKTVQSAQAASAEDDAQ